MVIATATSKAARSRADGNDDDARPTTTTTTTTKQNVVHRRDSNITTRTVNSGSTGGMSPGAMMMMVTCGCRPRITTTGATTQKRRRGIIQKWKLRKYKDAKEPSSPRDAPFEEIVEEEGEEEEDLFFFEAMEDPLEEYDSKTLLVGEKVLAEIIKEKEERLEETTRKDVKRKPTTAPPSPQLRRRKPLDLLQKEPSQRFYDIVNTPIEEHMYNLRHPHAILEGDAYPGRLTEQQLRECSKFINGLQEIYQQSGHPTDLLEQIYSFRDVEDPVYTICRWVRATKFNATEILTRCIENQSMFDSAKQHQFYPHPSQALGAPFPVYLRQYPFLTIGRATNGVAVNYFLAGHINPEGILAMTTIEKLEGYFWWTFMHRMKRNIRQQQAVDDTYCRCEGINIIDLEGLSSSALTSETMQVIQLASKVSDFFPETLHKMLILNAPRFFVMAWSVIKQFIDPQTARRIQMFSSKEAGLKALHELIGATNQIPKEYGGTNISIQEAFIREAHDPLLLRQEIELLHIKRKGDKKQVEWTIQENEIMELNCFTRCCSGASITVRVNGRPLDTIVNTVKGDVDNLSGKNHDKPSAKHYLLATSICGGEENSTTTVTIELTDLDGVDRKHNGQSRGYYLLVGDIRRRGTCASADTAGIPAPSSPSS